MTRTALTALLVAMPAIAFAQEAEDAPASAAGFETAPALGFGDAPAAGFETAPSLGFGGDEAEEAADDETAEAGPSGDGTEPGADDAAEPALEAADAAADEADLPAADAEGGEQAADAGRAERPGGAPAEKPVSDGLAECASILAVASGQSRNFVERDNLSNAASEWFAISGDIAESEEGGLPAEGLWEEKVAAWSDRISGVGSLALQPEWMAYCADVGAERGLWTEVFEANLPAEVEVETGESAGAEG